MATETNATITLANLIRPYQYHITGRQFNNINNELDNDLMHQRNRWLEDANGEPFYENDGIKYYKATVSFPDIDSDGTPRSGSEDRTALVVYVQAKGRKVAVCFASDSHIVRNQLMGFADSNGKRETHGSAPLGFRLRSMFHSIFNSTNPVRSDLKAFIGKPNLGNPYNWLEMLLIPVTISKSVLKTVVEFLPAVIQKTCGYLKDQCAKLANDENNWVFWGFLQGGRWLLAVLEGVAFLTRQITMRVTSPVRSFWQAYDFGVRAAKKIGLSEDAGKVLGGFLAIISGLASAVGIGAAAVFGVPAALGVVSTSAAAWVATAIANTTSFLGLNTLFNYIAVGFAKMQLSSGLLGLTGATAQACMVGLGALVAIPLRSLAKWGLRKLAEPIRSFVNWVTSCCRGNDSDDQQKKSRGSLTDAASSNRSQNASRTQSPSHPGSTIVSSIPQSQPVYEARASADDAAKLASRGGATEDILTNLGESSATATAVKALVGADLDDAEASAEAGPHSPRGFAGGAGLFAPATSSPASPPPSTVRRLSYSDSDS